MTKTLKDFKVTDIRPPGPSSAYGYTVTGSGTSDDDTHYILKPDSQFNRPWIATVGGTAYVWPAGIQGFQLTSNAQTGIHHYLGQDQTDVSLVYPDELHVILSGNFPGKTSVANMHALRSVILQPSFRFGKILALPGVQEQLLYVQCINHSFSHDVQDGTYDISYTIEFIKTGSGSTVSSQPLRLPQPNPVAVTQPRGKSHRRVAARPGTQTLRSMASRVYGDTTQASILKLFIKNADTLAKAGITGPSITTKKIPLGTVLDF